jgi:hypothetical protein
MKCGRGVSAMFSLGQIDRGSLKRRDVKLLLTCNRNAHYPPHKHSGVTTHVILDGSLTYTYPNDADAKRQTLGVGERWDVDANKVHEVWVGEEGCTYVIGE